MTKRLDIHRLKSAEEFEDKEVRNFYKALGVLVSSESVPLRLASGNKVLTIGMLFEMCCRYGMDIKIEVSKDNMKATLRNGVGK